MELSFAYDADGIRTSKTVLLTGEQNTATHSYITESGKVVYEEIRTGSTVTDTMYFVYDGSGQPFALKHTSGNETNVYYYVLNVQGDVVGLIDANGNYVAQYIYDAWGNVLASSGDLAEINPLRYRGYYYDTETGFYYLQSRYYDPVQRRFVNADSIASTGVDISGTNMFAYCLNNPVILVDCEGTAAGMLPPTTFAIFESGTPKETGYDTPDEAAIAFAEDYYFYTIRTNCEASALIYSFTANGKTYYDYGFMVFSQDEHGTALYAIPWEVGGELQGRAIVGEIHTHPNEEFFSPEDVRGIEKNIKEIGPHYVGYIATRHFNVRKYDPNGDPEWKGIIVGSFVPTHKGGGSPSIGGKVHMIF